MAISVRAVSTAFNGAAGSTSINKPTGTLNGDLLIMQICGNDVAATPTNFTLIRATGNSSLFYKYASGEGSSYSISNAGSRIVAGLAAIAGAKLTSAIQDNGQTNASSGTATTPGLTPAAANSLVCLFFMSNASNGFTVDTATIATSPPTFTEGWRNFGGITEVPYFAYGVRAEVTATGNGTATLAANATSSGQILVIAPGEDVAPAPPVAELTLTGLAQILPVNIADLTLTPLAPRASGWFNPSKSADPSWDALDKT